MAGKTAGIIIIGDEILKGQVVDTNSHFICKRLRALGTKVKKVSVVEDNVAEIAEVVKEFSGKFDIVLTSGGIGPTHDDVTYKGIAEGFSEELVCSEILREFWKGIVVLSQSSQAMSLVPKSAKIIWSSPNRCFWMDAKGSEVRKIPIVSVHNVFVFPGIPKFLEEAFSFLEKTHFHSHGCSFYTGRIFLSVHEDLYLEALNKTVEELQECVFGSYPVVGNPKYITHITVEADTVAKVQRAEDYFKSLIPSEWLVSCSSEMTNNLVYKFLQTTADSHMSDMLGRSIKIVEEALDRYANGWMLSFNGGKDCTVLLHIVKAVKEHKGIKGRLPAVYFRPEHPFTEVEQFVKETEIKFEVELTTLPGPIKPALVELVKDKPNIKAILLGTRRTDPFSQDLQHFQMTDPGWTEVMRVNPLLDWSYHDIWTFLLAIEAPYCVLYDQGYTSLGNVDNTRPNPSLLYTKADGSQGYHPAWQLTDDSVERNGRS